VAVKVVEAKGETIARDVEFTASIEPWQKNYIIPALQGARIDRIHVKVGDKVRKGQLVAQMDPTQYITAKIQLETAEADYNRIKTVHEAGGVSAQTLEQTEAAYKVRREQADNLARHVKLYSPIDGVVTAKGEEEGNLFTQTPILELMQINKLKVKVHISEQYYSNVAIGTPVKISVDVFPDETFTGNVSLLYPAIDPATRTFGAEITILNPNHHLRPGMFARCVINMGNKEGVLVPDIAVQKQIGTNERYLYVISDSTAHRRLVTPGLQIGDMVDIEEGLAAGEQVALTSFSRLSDGTAVRVSE
jgi:RND family efflux transporter MFP subunit